MHVIVNTGAGDAFQTGLDMAQLARDPDALREQSRRTKRFELRFTAWHNDVWKPVIAAVNGVCAGGGLHFVADADIVHRVGGRHASSTRTSRSARPRVYETIALAKKSPMEAVLRMAFVGRHERMSAAARVRARHLLAGGRPARAAARPRPQALGELIAPQLARRARAHQARALGRARAGV